MEILFESMSKRLSRYAMSGPDGDGCETVALLAIIEWFVHPETHYPYQTDDDEEEEAMRHERDASDGEEEDHAGGSGVTKKPFTYGNDDEVFQSKSLFRAATMGMSKPNAQEQSPQEILAEYACPAYFTQVLLNIKADLVAKLDAYVTEQISWLDSQVKQYANAKKLSVFGPFEKFPCFVDQLQEMTGQLVRETDDL